MQVEQIIFMQGESEELDIALDILKTEGPDMAILHLMQWHYPGEHETAEIPAAGTDDDTHKDEHGYILTWNSRIGYIGLEYVVE
jgi:hypothetical protein